MNRDPNIYTSPAVVVATENEVAQAAEIVAEAFNGMLPYLEVLSTLGAGQIKNVRRALYGQDTPHARSMNMVLYHTQEIVRLLDSIATTTTN